jgi:hypothetical protein
MLQQAEETTIFGLEVLQVLLKQEQEQILFMVE